MSITQELLDQVRSQAKGMTLRKEASSKAGVLDDLTPAQLEELAGRLEVSGEKQAAFATIAKARQHSKEASAPVDAAAAEVRLRKLAYQEALRKIGRDPRPGLNPLNLLFPDIKTATTKLANYAASITCDLISQAVSIADIPEDDEGAE